MSCIGSSITSKGGGGLVSWIITGGGGEELVSWIRSSITSRGGGGGLVSRIRSSITSREGEGGLVSWIESSITGGRGGGELVSWEAWSGEFSGTMHDCSSHTVEPFFFLRATEILREGSFPCHCGVVAAVDKTTAREV